MELYPLKFYPIFKEVIWGGSKIHKFKHIPSDQNNIGESWEISGLDNHISVVSNGELKGKNLKELIDIYKDRLVGKKNYEIFGNTFPLLIKFIDAKENLSVQVHPDDSLAKKRHGASGKAEMWYIIDADEGATTYLGFRKRTTPEELAENIKQCTLENLLAEHKMEKGNVFFLPPGRVHAIGAGTFLAEIQQSSDITYRIYDYNRKDAKGNLRELHTHLAEDVIDYNTYEDYKLDYKHRKDDLVSLESNQYFTTNLLDLSTTLQRDLSGLNSFSIYICVGGNASITDNNNHTIGIKQGETVLIPANTQSIRIIPSPEVSLLETFI
ncbi:MAG: type I phosphomannose isomerase catalytic subunit [Dysgonomonas sp.]